MLDKINPSSIVAAHVRTLRNYGTDKLNPFDLGLHFVVPAIFALIHVRYFQVDKDVVSIAVSAASIIAGLMLNLLVLVYTLLFNNRDKQNLVANFSDFKEVCRETLASIAFSVLLSLVLVVAALVCLTEAVAFNFVGHIVMVYAGVALIFTMLMILKRCYILINFEFIVL